jgi:alginate O-acetyltransferase complex protein AlgJ
MSTAPTPNTAPGTAPNAAPPHAGRGGPTDPSHDEELRRGILHTQISRRLAWALAGVFLLAIYGLPISQAVMEKVKDEDSMLLDVFTRAPTKENLKQYEDDLDKASYAKEAVQPRLQTALTRFGGAGNKKAVIGRDGWLYYQPGVMSIAGPGFLDADVNAAKVKSTLDETGEVLHPDPRPAVLDLHRALRARGIQLVLFPVPDKASLQPAELHGRRSAPGPAARNRDHAAFVAELRAAGVVVFEGPPDAAMAGGAPRFLTQDTHWTPGWMAATARALADELLRRSLVKRGDVVWRRVPLQVTRVGDIVDMLKLPEDQTAFSPSTIAIEQIKDASGKAWEAPERPEAADVLLLGDSFSNIFTLGQMGWGEAAGFAPHLAAALGRHVDVIAQNDSGAFATRQALSRALAAGEDRLAGKRVVIWEFASRELAVGDWKPLSFALGPVSEATPEARR